MGSQNVWSSCVFHMFSADVHVLPIGCKYGGCITCAAKLIKGKVRQPGATALNRRQSEAGFILLCVAKPKSDCLIEEGVESHGDLYQNPFTSTGFKR